MVGLAPCAHHVLGAAGDHQLPLVDEAQVAGAQPAVRGEPGPRVAAAVAAGHTGAAQLDLPQDPGPDLAVGAQPQLDPWDRGPQQHQPQPAGDEAHPLPRNQAQRIDGDRAQRAPGEREARAEARLGQAVDRVHRLGGEARRGEARAEGRAGCGVDLVGADEHPPHTAQVQALQLARLEPRQAELEREGGRGEQGRAQPAGGVQPARRPADEVPRAEQELVDPQVERDQVKADQAHVVGQRDPAQREVPAAELRGAGDPVEVRDHVAVAEFDAPRVCGGARRELDQRQVVGLGGARPRRVRAGQPLQAQGPRALTQRAAERLQPLDHLGLDDQPRVAGPLRRGGGFPPQHPQHAFELAQVVGGAAGGHRRGDAPPEHAAPEAEEELPRVRQLQGHGRPPGHPGRVEPAGHPQRAGAQRGVGEARADRNVGAEKAHAALAARREVEQLREGGDGGGDRAHARPMAIRNRAWARTAPGSESA